MTKFAESKIYNFKTSINDGWRLYLDDKPKIEFLTIHHSAFWFHNTDRKSVQGILDRIGYERFYAPAGYKRDSAIDGKWGEHKHFMPGTNRGISWCSYHFAIWLNNNKLNVIGLIDDPLNNQAGSTGSFEHNRRSICICVLGDYTKEEVPEGLKEFIEKEFDWLKKMYPYIEVIGHKQVDNTECPGKLQEKIVKEIWK